MLGDTFLGLAHELRQDRGVVVLPQQREKLFLREQQHLAVVERDDVEAPRLIQDASWQAERRIRAPHVPPVAGRRFVREQLLIDISAQVAEAVLDGVRRRTFWRL